MNRSFSYEIKKELSELSNLAKKNEVKYELVGYLSSANSEFDKNKIIFNFTSLIFAFDDTKI